MNLTRSMMLRGLRHAWWIWEQPHVKLRRDGGGALEFIEVHHQQECLVWFNVERQTWRAVSRPGGIITVSHPPWQ